jgi:Flp pilus assembly protein TadD
VDLKRILLFGVVPLALTGASCATVNHGSAVQTTVATPAPKAPDTAANSPFSPSADVSVFLAQAQQARKSGDLAKAIKVLSQLVLVAPDNPQVLGEYGKTLAAYGRSDDAIAFLDRAIQLQAGDWTFYSAQGVAYDQQGKYRLAQLSYARALQLKPGEVAVINNDALSHIQAGDYDGAARLLNQVSRDSPDYARISNSVALLQKLKPAAPATAAGPATADEVAADNKEAPRDAAVASLPAVTPKQESAVGLPSMLASSQERAVASAPPITQKQEFVPVAPPQPIFSVDLPVAKAKQPKPELTPAAPFRSTLDRLKADPTVVMQRLPADHPEIRVADAPLAKAARLGTPVIDHGTSFAGPAVPAPGFYVQAGSYLSDARARQAAVGLESLNVKIMQATVNGREVFRLRIGPFAGVADAKKSYEEAKALGRSDLIIVRE